jgi:hypothetical protein
MYFDPKPTKGLGPEVLKTFSDVGVFGGQICDSGLRILIEDVVWFSLLAVDQALRDDD